MSKVIIAIHGLGNKPPKEQLRQAGIMSIKEGLLKKKKTTLELPEFELLYWADLFYNKPQSIFEKDKNSPYYLDEVYTKEPDNYQFKSHEVRRYFMDIFKKMAYKIFLKKDYYLRYAFVSQRLLHKYFHELDVYFTGENKFNAKFNVSLKKEIRDRLTNIIKKHSDDEIMLISHSMGTIIAFDVLSFSTQNMKVNTFVTMGAPLGAPFVMSKIAAHSRKINGWINIQTPENVYKDWYNFSDIRDKITLDYKLSEDFNANSRGVKCIDKVVTNTYAMNGIANPHKSYGYLRTPEFIDVLIDFVNS